MFEAVLKVAHIVTILPNQRVLGSAFVKEIAT